LLRREKTLESVIRCMSNVINLPLTVKTRTGVYTDRNILHTFMPKFQEWGASLVTVSFSQWCIQARVLLLVPLEHECTSVSFTCSIVLFCYYCDGFAQGITGRQAAGHVLVHAPRNSTVEAFPSCPRMHG
jgi:hypothetical protein